MKISRILISPLFISLLTLFQAHAQSLEFEKTTVGESRVEVDLKDFQIEHTNQEVAVLFIPKSVRWQRNTDNLLIPKVLLKIVISPKILGNKITLEHENASFIPSVTKSGIRKIDLSVDLFNPGVIKIFDGESVIDEIKLNSKNDKKYKQKQLIDYSCSPYDIKIQGADNDYLSVGCKLEKMGALGSETPRLLVTLSSPTMLAPNGTKPPFKLILTDNNPALIELKDQHNVFKNISIKATLPARLYRLKVAMGLGPYLSSAEQAGLKENGKPGASIMFYGKYDLTQSSSIRFFNATVYPKTLFNNAGLYFSYDLAEILDGRIVLNTLLGAQALHLKFNNKSKMNFDFLYPQGFELTYKHIFNRENYHLTYGMFLSNGEKKYTNAWIRYGTSFFYEANYISWQKLDSEYHTWGLSIGFPIGKGY